MSEISDELLMAYADGQISPADRAIVEQALARDTDLLERVKVFEVSRDALRHLFNEASVEPVPDRLVRNVLSSIGEASQPIHVARTAPQSVGTDGGYLQRLAEFFGGWAYVLGPVAATGALVLAGTAGWVAHQSLRPAPTAQDLVTVRDGKLLAAGRLHQTLEVEASNRAVQVNLDRSARSLRVLNTFKTATGNFCREFEVVASDEGAQVGVGCRQLGQWHIQAYGPAPKRTARGPGVTIAGDRQASVTDAAIDRIIDGPTFNQFQEAQAIAQGWQGD